MISKKRGVGGQWTITSSDRSPYLWSSLRLGVQKNSIPSFTRGMVVRKLNKLRRNRHPAHEVSPSAMGGVGQWWIIANSNCTSHLWSVLSQGGWETRPLHWPTLEAWRLRNLTLSSSLGVEVGHSTPPPPLFVLIELLRSRNRPSSLLPSTLKGESSSRGKDWSAIKDDTSIRSNPLPSGGGY